MNKILESILLKSDERYNERMREKLLDATSISHIIRVDYYITRDEKTERYGLIDMATGKEVDAIEY